MRSTCGPSPARRQGAGLDRGRTESHVVARVARAPVRFGRSVSEKLRVASYTVVGDSFKADKPQPFVFDKEGFKNDPLIQKALEVFKGTIVEVRA